jgi:hypothetical protein
VLALVRGGPGARRISARGAELGKVREAEALDAALAQLDERFAELLTDGPTALPGDGDDGSPAPLWPSVLTKLAARVREASGCAPPSLDELTSVPLAELDRHAAAIALAVAKLPYNESARRDEVHRLLAQAARARLVLGPVTDRPWATYTGCGLNIDGEQPELVGCGMGHVPDKARRFLYLYTKAEREDGKR